VIVEPDEVLTEPEAYRLLGEEVTRQLDYVPPRYICRRIIRRRYARIDAPYQPPVIASLPVMLERCKVGPSLLAVIITGKFCDHLPLYRQQEIAWTRHRIDISRQDMARWLDLAALWLKPIYQMILGGMWGDGYVQIDETVIKYLAPGTGKAQQGYFWTVHRPGGGTAFHWSTERAAAVLEEFVPEGFKGVIQCDGYSAYRAYARPRAERIRLAACWAHVRRDFFKASQTGAWRADAGLMVRLIGRLYEIEARLREKGAGPALRAASRASECRAIVLRIGKILENWKARRRHFPSSTMGKACAYALNLWDDLLVYLEDGRIEIDNNEVENSIRPTAVGKKNWLFIGAAEAGERCAILFTVVEACRRYGINPFEYLRDVFTRMPGMRAAEYAKLTPAAWAVAHRVGLREAAAKSPDPAVARCA
jgi:transposase